MRRIVLASLCVATTAFVPPKRDVQVEIAGVYRAEGTHPDGSSYEGQATLTRLSAERYSIRFDMPNGVFRALCVRSLDLLGCAWGSTDTLTAAILRPTAGGGMVATWAGETNAELGREVLGPDLAGWAFAKYGSLERVVWTATTNGVIHTKPGWALRSGPVVIAGFPMPLAGAAFYRIESNGRLLSGDWMDPLMPDAGRGTETLTR